ncbi:MAG TPA: hypothetical protein VJ827_08345, partial [Rubrobacter sp.]|nr:hypothetical protein [Rubrobacter sp.]
MKDAFDHVLVGAQSGIDDIHVLRSSGDTEGEIVTLFSEREDAEVQIERGLVRPFLRGEDPHRYQVAKNTFYCIYPYRLTDGKTKIIEEIDLKRDFPLGYAYLVKYRNELR